MSSPDPKLKEGLNLPVWMKSRPTKDFEPFATSPPPAEDSFFFIKYPNSDILYGSQKLDQDFQKATQEQIKLRQEGYNPREKDWSKHTKPCQDVLHGIAPINTAVNPSSKPKPAGTDDGFKGEGAACASSIVKVAHEMMSMRTSRGFTVAPAPAEDDPLPPHRPGRRGSKSLPGTPGHSPTARRKNTNKYFTSPFESDGEAQGRGWLTAALLGFKKDLTGSSSTLAEEDALETRLQGATLAESVENLGPAPKVLNSDISKPQAPAKPAKQGPSFLPKPSELREMNFWSPTSM